MAQVIEWQQRAAALADRLRADGAIIDPAWHEIVAATPRHVFVPQVLDGEQTLTAETDEEQWLAAAYSVDALLTARGNRLPTSSSSAPPIMAIMLERLDLHPGHRVLEIGTGTGYIAALLCRRVGDGNVVSVDIDAELVDAARTRLADLGQHPTVVTADGDDGVPGGAPYDRIIATCAATHISPAWIRQLRPGGRIVTPLTNDAMAVLTKTALDEVSGRIDATPAFFMPLRRRADDPLGPQESTNFDHPGIGHYGTTTLDPAVLRGCDRDLDLFLRLHIPGLRIAAADTSVVVHTPDAMAEADMDPIDGGNWRVVQRGARRLWDTMETATRTWDQLGHPDRTRYGLTALDDVHRQYIWLDDPAGDHSWPLV